MADGVEWRCHSFFILLVAVMIKEEILELLEKTAEDLGYTVYESSIYFSGDNSKIMVKIDSINGISHGDCEKYSTEVGIRIDEDGTLPKYLLEISSPGLDRKLRNTDDFIRFNKSPVRLVFIDGDDRKFVKGILSEVNENGIEVTDENNKIFSIKHADIVNANLDY